MGYHILYERSNILNSDWEVFCLSYSVSLMKAYRRTLL